MIARLAPGETQTRGRLPFEHLSGHHRFVFIIAVFLRRRHVFRRQPGIEEVKLYGAAHARLDGSGGQPLAALFGVREVLPDTLDGAWEHARDPYLASANDLGILVQAAIEANENLPPTFLRALCPLRRNIFLRQREDTALAVRHNIDGHLRDLGGELWDAECEDETSGALDGEILSDVFHIIAVCAADDDEFAADTGVDVDANHLAGGSGEEKMPRYVGI